MAWILAAQILISVALTVASNLLAPKPQRSDPAAKEDIDVPTAEEGRPIYLLFGTRDVEASVVAWYGDVKAKPIKKKGGKK